MKYLPVSDCERTEKRLSFMEMIYGYFQSTWLNVRVDFHRIYPVDRTELELC